MIRFLTHLFGVELRRPLKLVLFCPACRAQHIDRGPWETREHLTHLCESCHHLWVASEVCSVGVEAL